VALLLVWIGLGVLLYFKRETALIVVMVGGLLALAGLVWFLIEMFSASTIWGVVSLITGLLCWPIFLICGVIAMVMNAGAGVRGYVVYALGVCIWLTGYVLFAGSVLQAIREGKAFPGATQPEFQPGAPPPQVPKGPGMAPQGPEPQPMP